MNELKVNLSNKPDFYMEAIVSLYERKWNQTEVLIESEVKYGCSKDMLMEKFGKIKQYRDVVIADIDASGYDFRFIDRFIENDVDKFPYLLRMYFYCKNKPDFSYTDEEADSVIGDFVLERIQEVVDSASKISSVSDIGEVFMLLNSPMIDSAERMLYLDTYGNRRQIVEAIREYMKIAVPILEKHFPIVEEEFEKELKIHNEVTDWRSFYSYFSLRFADSVRTMNATLGILLFYRIRSVTSGSKGDYSMIGMKYVELKELERVALVNNGILLEYMKALSDATRLRILSQLKRSTMRVKDLAKVLNLTAPTISHHIAILQRVGIVNLVMSHDEIGVYEYRIGSKRIKEICGLLEKLA